MTKRIRTGAPAMRAAVSRPLHPRERSTIWRFLSPPLHF
jgi:hypothetical protein